MMTSDSDFMTARSRDREYELKRSMVLSIWLELGPGADTQDLQDTIKYDFYRLWGDRLDARDVSYWIQQACLRYCREPVNISQSPETRKLKAMLADIAR